MILNEIPFVTGIVTDWELLWPSIIVLDIGFMRSSDFKSTYKIVIIYRFGFDIIKCHVWF